MDPKQREAFGEAVERKNEEAEARSRAHPRTGEPPPRDQQDDVHGEVQQSLIDDSTPQDVQSARDKNEGKGKKTADKWNQ